MSDPGIIRKIIYFLYGKAATLVVIEASGITQEILDIVQELCKELCKDHCKDHVGFPCTVKLHADNSEYLYEAINTVTKHIHVFPSLKEYTPQLLEPCELIIE